MKVTFYIYAYAIMNKILCVLQDKIEFKVVNFCCENNTDVNLTIFWENLVLMFFKKEKKIEWSNLIFELILDMKSLIDIILSKKQVEKSSKKI